MFIESGVFVIMRSRLLREKESVTFSSVDCMWVVENASGLILIPGRISDSLGRRVLILEGFVQPKPSSTVTETTL